MIQMRSLLTSVSFVALSTLALACGDDTGGSGGGGGAGGAGSGGGGTGGDATSTTTSNTTTTTGGGGTGCAAVATFASAKAAELSCTAVDQAEFTAECEQTYTDAAGCESELDTFYACLVALPDESWSCEAGTNDLVAADDSCPTEVEALVTCLQG